MLANLHQGYTLTVSVQSVQKSIKWMSADTEWTVRNLWSEISIPIRCLFKCKLQKCEGSLCLFISKQCFSCIDLHHLHYWGRPTKKRRKKKQNSTLQQDLMIPGERWQSVRRCLLPGQLWTPWDSPDESILHFYGRQKGEDNCSVLMAASNCFERWRTIIKPGVTNHLGSDKSPE